MKQLLFVCGVVLFSLVSCKKEASGSVQSNLDGNYKFISAEVNSTSVSKMSAGTDVEKSVTISHYITKKNTGTVSINSSEIATNNVGYLIDTTIRAYSYFDEQLTDSIEMPFKFTISPSSSKSSFKMITNDSAYFSSGTLFMSGITQQTVPVGVKFKTVGNRLFMTMNGTENRSQNAQGVTVNTSAVVSAKITLEKM